MIISFIRCVEQRLNHHSTIWTLYLQRGGRPTAHDRILASRTGVGAIEAIMQGQRNVMVGVRNNEIVYVPFSDAIRTDKPLDMKLIKVLDELSI